MTNSIVRQLTELESDDVPGFSEFWLEVEAAGPEEVEDDAEEFEDDGEEVVEDGGEVEDDGEEVSELVLSVSYKKQPIGINHFSMYDIY